MPEIQPTIDSFYPMYVRSKRRRSEQSSAASSPLDRLTECVGTLRVWRDRVAALLDVVSPIEDTISHTLRRGDGGPFGVELLEETSATVAEFLETNPLLARASEHLRAFDGWTTVEGTVVPDFPELNLFDFLPNELIDHITFYVPLHMLVSMALVCRRFAHVVKYHERPTVVVLGILSALQKKKITDFLHPKHLVVNLRSESQYWQPFDNDLTGFPRLRSLSLDSCTFSPASTFESLCTRLCQLTSFCLKGIKMRTTGAGEDGNKFTDEHLLQIRAMTGLKTLRLERQHHTTAWTADGVARLLSSDHFSRLSTLSLSHTFSKKDSLMTVLPRLQSLTSLDLGGCTVSGFSIESLAPLWRLCKLNLVRALPHDQAFGKNEWYHLSVFSHLTSLKVSQMPGSFFPHLTTLKDLRRLHLIDPMIILERQVSALTALKDLTFLHLEVNMHEGLSSGHSDDYYDFEDEDIKFEFPSLSTLSSLKSLTLGLAEHLEHCLIEHVRFLSGFTALTSLALDGINDHWNGPDCCYAPSLSILTSLQSLSLIGLDIERSDLNLPFLKSFSVDNCCLGKDVLLGWASLDTLRSLKLEGISGYEDFKALPAFTQLDRLDATTFDDESWAYEFQSHIRESLPHAVVTFKTE